MVVRPRSVAGRLPALLNFTIYADPGTTLDEARRTASNGYAGVEGLTRGKGCSPDPPVPYEKDGVDAAAVIDWISRQPWSDGRVGMFGGSYEGFTQWAAAKHMPKALKALMPSVTAAPGDRRADGRQCVPNLRLLLAVLHHDEQDARQRALQRPGPLAPDEPRVVRQGSGLPRRWTRSTARPIRSSTAGSIIRATTPTGRA